MAASICYHNFLVALVLHWAPSSKCGVQYTHMVRNSYTIRQSSVQGDSVNPTTACHCCGLHEVPLVLSVIQPYTLLEKDVAYLELTAEKKTVVSDI